jgi:hypothetical protein
MTRSEAATSTTVSAPGPITLALVALMLTACGGGAAPHPPADARARDSAIGASQLPGAQGVRGALRTTDSAAARRAREDSIAAESGP